MYNPPAVPGIFLALLAFGLAVPGTSLQAAPIAYDFSGDSLQGWSNILGSRVLRPSTSSVGTDWVRYYSSNSNEGGAGASLPSVLPTANWANRDNRHATLLVRSPQFTLDAGGSGDLSIDFIGGEGPAPATLPANDRSHVDLTHSVNGVARAFLRRVSDGAYVANLRRTGSGATLQTQNLDVSAFRDGATAYTIDFVDSNDGSWGWTGFDNVVINDATLVGTTPTGRIQFDMAQHGGNYLGENAPGHISSGQALSLFESNEDVWNGSGTDQSDGLLAWANGVPAPNLTIDFGRQENATGAINWGVDPSGSSSGAGAADLDTYLMRDWMYTGANDNMGVRIGGLDPGAYRVWAMVREPNQLGRTYGVAIGVNDDHYDVDAGQIDPGLTEHLINASATSDWTVNENYVMQDVVLTGSTDQIVVIVDATNAQWATLGGLQIASLTVVPEPSSFLLWALGMLGLRWYRRRFYTS